MTRKKHTNRETGAFGEDCAAKYLEDIGYEVVERNWRCREGEIDLVAIDGDWVAVVEVKTRTGHAAGHPFEAITPLKVSRLRRLAVAWAREHPDRREHLRIDVMAVTLGDASPLIEHIENAS